MSPLLQRWFERRMWIHCRLWEEEAHTAWSKSLRWLSANTCQRPWRKSFSYTTPSSLGWKWKEKTQNPEEEKDSYGASAVWELILKNRNALRANNARFLTLEVSCAAKWTRSESCLLFGDANQKKKMVHSRISTQPEQGPPSTDGPDWGGRVTGKTLCSVPLFARCVCRSAVREFTPSRHSWASQEQLHLLFFLQEAVKGWGGFLIAVD